METDRLADYVKDRIEAGRSRQAIQDELLAVGWTVEEADAAYRAGLLARGIPLPDASSRPPPLRKPSTADVALSFFAFILMGVTASALGTLYFQIIDSRLPDPLAAIAGANGRAATRTIHYATASLLIAFPLYVAAMRGWFRTFGADEGKTESGLTRWLTYLVLLVAAVVIVGDLIATLFRLLQGEATVRFLLKALAILVLAGLVFGFYTFERRKIQYRRHVPRTLFHAIGWTVTGLVAAGVTLGLLTAGSPETTRMRAFDMQREADLERLAGCIGQYAEALGQLPASLDALRTSGRHAHCANSMHDPETGQVYVYRIVVPSREQGPARLGEFELCADFSLASTGDAGAMRRTTIWNTHGAGTECDTVAVQLGDAVSISPGAR